MRGSATMLRRDFKHTLRNPTVLFGAFFFPLIYLLLFVYVLGGAFAIGERYVNYIVPGIIATAVGTGMTMTALGVADDMAQGIIDRFRTMAISPASVLAGHVLGSMIVPNCLRPKSYEPSVALENEPMPLKCGHFQSAVRASSVSPGSTSSPGPNAITNVRRPSRSESRCCLSFGVLPSAVIAPPLVYSGAAQAASSAVDRTPSEAARSIESENGMDYILVGAGRGSHGHTSLAVAALASSCPCAACASWRFRRRPRRAVKNAAGPYFGGSCRGRSDFG
jgi:ABC-2 type transporter